MSKPEPLAMFTWDLCKAEDEKAVFGAVGRGEGRVHKGTRRDGRVRPPVLLNGEEVRGTFGKVLPEVAMKLSTSALLISVVSR